MRKLLMICLFPLLASMISGCAGTSSVDLGDSIAAIHISSLPESEDYERLYTSDEKVSLISDYLEGLSLKDKFTENPDDYAGMSFIISVIYEDGSKELYTLFGNMFFRSEDGGWKRMKYEEASRLNSIVMNTPGDL